MGKQDAGDWAAFSAITPDDVAASATTLECDGESFELQSDEFNGTHYRWLSGPNPGYGFSASPTTDDVEQHWANIRSFLSMIDPETGYIEED